MNLKTIAALIVTTHFALASKAQAPEDLAICGTWINLGYASGGNFYPANFWNEETITFREDYTYEREEKQIVDHQVGTALSLGKWSLTDHNTKLRFYSDNDRYFPQGKIILFDKEYEVDYFSDAYFTVKDSRSGYPVIVRFQKAGTKQTFAEDVAAVNALVPDYVVKYDTNSAVYYLVNSLRPEKKKTLYFDDPYFNISYLEHPADSLVEERTGSFFAGIYEFSDSSIRFSFYSEDMQTEYKDSTYTTISSDYYNSMDYDVVMHKKEIPLVNLSGVKYEGNFSGSSIAPILAGLSGLTTLIIAPLISIGYKHGDFNKNRYFKTAGIGLIGLGASIPIAVIFKPKKINLIPPNGPKDKKNWYLEKVRE